MFVLANRLKIWFSLYVVTVIITGVLSFQMVLDYSCTQILNMSIVPVLLLMIVSVVLFVFLIKKNKQNISYVFLLVAIPACFAFSLFMIPDSVPDEAMHLFRVFDLGYNGETAWIPSAIEYGSYPQNYSDYKGALVQTTDYASLIGTETTAGGYSVFMYLFSGIVVFVGKYFISNIFILIILGRLANALLYVVSCYYILKKIPFGKTVLFVFFLNPILIQSECSCSADAITNIIVFVFLCMVVVNYCSKMQNKKDVILFVIISFLMLFIKIAYVPLLLCWAIFIPFIDSKKVRIVLYGVLVVFFLCLAVFIFIYPMSETTIGYMIDLFRHPIECFTVLSRTIYENSDFWLRTFLGEKLGNLNINVWSFVPTVYCLLLFSTLFVSAYQESSFPNSVKVVFTTIVVGVFIAIICALRMWSVTILQNPLVIEGVQGRYFIPLVALLLLAFSGGKKTSVLPNCIIPYASLCSFVLLWCLMTAVIFFV